MKRRIGAGFAALALADTIVAGTAVSAFADPLSSNQFKKLGLKECAGDGNS